MKKQNELKNKMLTKEQADTVKEMIMNSMRNTYTDQGSLPGDGFQQVAGVIADKIIKNTQMALIQTNVFKKIVNESKPLKKGKGFIATRIKDGPIHVTYYNKKTGKVTGKKIIKKNARK